MLLALVSFSLRNADGQGDFFDGFAPDCTAPDDASHQLGDPEEGSLKEALTVAETARAASGRSHRNGTPTVRDPAACPGLAAVVNAY